jgi:very-long-chain (3R)-3-hydroxyacyl-CoA dehydratase
MFYALSLLMGAAPYISLWTRYNFFFILYPMGAGSEWMLVNAARPFTKDLFHYFLLAMQVIYFPGFIHMYTHMIKQRTKALFHTPKKQKSV